MKRKFCGLMGIILLGSVAYPQAILPSGSANSQPAKVYFQGKGPERTVRRFQKFLEIALDDYDMARTDSFKDADATVKVQFTREEKTEYLYAPVVWITVESADHQEYITKSCSVVSTSNSVFNDPIKSVETVSLPESWKRHGHHLTVYVNDAEVKGLKDLVPAVKQKLTDEGYQLTQVRADADAELESIKLQKMAIPMRVTADQRSFEVFGRKSDRFNYTTGQGSGDITYLGVEQGIKVENLPCRQTVEHFTIDTEGAWRDARNIAKSIRKYLDKAAHSN